MEVEKDVVCALLLPVDGKPHDIPNQELRTRRAIIVKDED